MKQILTAVTICNVVLTAYGRGECKGCEDEKDYDDPIKCQNYVTQNPQNPQGCTGWEPKEEYIAALAKLGTPNIKSCPNSEFGSVDGICKGCEDLGIEDEITCTKFISMNNLHGCQEWIPFDENHEIDADHNNNNNGQVQQKQKQKPSQQQPLKIHARTPNHCAYTAEYSVAQNQLKGGVDWTPKIWNTNAEQIDDIYKLKGNQKMHQGTYVMKKYWSGKGAFSKIFEQMMIRTVGLNFGSSSVKEPYPPMVNGGKPYFQDSYLETQTGIARGAKHKHDAKKYAKYKALLLRSNAFYINSKGVPSRMIGMIIAVNTAPYKKFQNNHNAAFFQWVDGNFYYIDTNVHEIQTLQQFNAGSYKMCNVYNGKTISNGQKRAKKKFTNGYLVDHSLNLGHNIKSVTDWLYDKLEVRPRWFGEHGAGTGTTAAKTDAGGAFWYRVIVGDDIIPWEKILEYNTVYKATNDAKQAEAVISSARFINDYNYYDNDYEEYGHDERDEYVEEEKHDYFEHFNFNDDYQEPLSLMIMGEVIALNVLVILLIFICFAICGAVIGYMLYHHVNKK